MTLIGKRQREFASAYAAMGYQGVKELVLAIAEKEDARKSGTSWTKIVAAGADVPGAKDDLIFRYLAGMHHLMLQALIDGTIGRKAATDSEFKGVLHWYHTLDVRPCTYINVPCRSEFDGAVFSSQAARDASKPSSWAGCGPSPQQLEEVCVTMQRYVRHRTDATSVEEAGEIDKQYTAVNDKDRPVIVSASRFKRRYLVSPEAIEKIQVWIDTVERTVIGPARQSMTAQQFQEPLPWSFQEVGFEVKGMVRAIDHIIHGGTNYLFGLYTSVLRYKFGRMFETKQWSLNLVARPEEADIAELLGSLIGGTYHTGGGLNPHLAGGANMSGKNAINKSELDYIYDEVKDILAHSPMWDINWRVDDEKAERFRKCIHAVEHLPELHAKIDAKKDEVVKAKKVLEEKLELIRTLEAKAERRARLKALVQKAKESEAALIARLDSILPLQKKGDGAGEESSEKPALGPKRDIPADAPEMDEGDDLPPPAKKPRLDRESSPEILVARSDD